MQDATYLHIFTMDQILKIFIWNVVITILIPLNRRNFIRQQLQGAGVVIGTQGRKPGNVGQLSRRTARHFPTKILPKPGMTRSNLTRKCIVCFPAERELRQEAGLPQLNLESVGLAFVSTLVSACTTHTQVPCPSVQASPGQGKVILRCHTRPRNDLHICWPFVPGILQSWMDSLYKWSVM